MGVIMLKHDIQQAIANNVNFFENYYGDLIFDKDNKDYIKSLFFMKQLNISIYDNKLLYGIKIDERVRKMLNVNDIEEIKKKNFHDSHFLTLAEKMMTIFFKDYKIGFKKDIQNINDINIKTKDEIYTIIEIKKFFKRELRILPTITASDKDVCLSVDMTLMCFNENMLLKLEEIFPKLEFLAFTPIYDEGKRVQGIRLSMCL